MSRARIRSLDVPRRLWQESRILRFLIVGGWNTVFGYLCFYGLYVLAANRVHYLVVTAVAHSINILQAYVMHRWLVFRSHAKITNEFLRFNASYVGTFLLGLLVMFLLVEATGLSPPVAQAIVILLNVIISYLLHSHVSFGRSAGRQGPPS